MKKGRQGDSSPRSEDLEPEALPRFVEVGDRRVPIFPVSVLLDVAKLVERTRARRAQEVGINRSKSSMICDLVDS